MSKLGNLIERFSEDIDIAIDPALYGMSGDLTKKQLKTLRKRSSMYVKEELAVTLRKAVITTATPAKTFVEKACLLHELFSVEHGEIPANRRSRHLYDLERMMDLDFAKEAMTDNALWESVLHHRSVFTSMKDGDYGTDFRKNIVLCPPDHILPDWEADYRQMCQTMIYGEKLPFAKLLERIKVLENRFHALS